MMCCFYGAATSDVTELLCIPLTLLYYKVVVMLPTPNVSVLEGTKVTVQIHALQHLLDDMLQNCTLKQLFQTTFFTMRLNANDLENSDSQLKHIF